ncbi:hypothetical protein LG201_08795 [Methylobacillus gramineus]|uniref:hypothetical protein n=1 Tax=Methylobacillus gramineus TaxID=755169 RepID=UPI001CFFB344|nr:hypothetical protein [Methylobacillus gramineus]MCB5185300.1 hypothetical protein [Methylobacillus gramineus]
MKTDHSIEFSLKILLMLSLLIPLSGLAATETIKPQSFNLQLEKQPKAYKYASTEDLLPWAREVASQVPTQDRYTTYEEINRMRAGGGITPDPAYFAMRSSVYDARDILVSSKADPLCHFIQNKLSGYTVFAIGGLLAAPIPALNEYKQVTLLKSLSATQSPQALQTPTGRMPYTSYRVTGEGIVTDYINANEMERSLPLDAAVLRDLAPNMACEVVMKLSYPYFTQFIATQPPTDINRYEMVRMGEAAVATIVQMKIFDKRNNTLLLTYPATAPD